jgi:hypothetical protein
LRISQPIKIETMRATTIYFVDSARPLAGGSRLNWHR